MMPTAPGKTGSSWENDNLDDGSAGALRNRDRMGDVTLRGRGVGDSSVLRESKAATPTLLFRVAALHRGSGNPEALGLEFAMVHS